MMSTTADETDWKTITDPLLRRKLQNRLNQRASRQRKTNAQQSKQLVIKNWSIKDYKHVRQTLVNDAGQTHETSSKAVAAGSDALVCRNDVTHAELDDLAGLREEVRYHLCEYIDRHAPAQDFPLNLSPVEQKFLQLWWRRRHEHGLFSDRLLTLIYYNLFRALISNANTLGLDTDQMCHGDVYPSPFLPLSPTASSAITNLPVALRPTDLQKQAYHHAYVDLFPCPVIRDNILRCRVTDEAEDEMCEDLVGCGGNITEFLILDEGPRIGMTVWGNPWDIRNWELSEFLAVKWGWIWRGAFELQEATNTRRRARGWKEISFA